MPRSRSATATIKGYYYQFDYFIHKLLNCGDETDTVCIEGIEDIDVNTALETTAIQCKYYAGTEYNHSIIAEPIKYMLDDFLNTSTPRIRYKLYGYYSSGQTKLTLPLTRDYFKSNFLKLKVFSGVELEDDIIDDFLSMLEIDINASDYDKQIADIINSLKYTFSCNEFDAEYYYYNNSLRLIKELSIDPDISKRTISKKSFLDQINKKEALFNEWFISLKGIDNYCSKIKREYFSPRNLSAYERFFLIECDSTINDAEIKTLLIHIGDKYSKLSRRDPSTFCSYIYIHNLNPDRLLKILNTLYNDEYFFIDGYDYKNSEFSVKSICRKATYHNQIKLKLIYSLDSLTDIFAHTRITKEIYQFYMDKAFYENGVHKHIKIPIAQMNNLIKIL